MSMFLFKMLLTSVVWCSAFIVFGFFAEALKSRVWRNRVQGFCENMSYTLALTSVGFLVAWVLSIIWRLIG